MGEIADGMLDGTLCQVCGVYLGEDTGSASFCTACAPEDTAPSRTGFVTANDKPEECLVCGRRFTDRQACTQHEKSAKHKIGADRIRSYRTSRDRLQAEVEKLKAESERLRQDRADVLNVKSKDGLTSSEWIMRTGKAERERDEARALLAKVADALCELQAREATYRLVHDTQGHGSPSSGRAWDQMRKSGNSARTIILEIREHLPAEGEEVDGG